MKRALLFILAVILTLSLSSCITINIPTGQPGEGSTPAQTGDSGQDPGTTAADEPDDPDEPEMTVRERIEAFDSTIEETVIFDGQGIRLTAKDLSYGNGTAYLKVKAENGTDEKLTFVAGSALGSVNSVNGYMVGGGYVFQSLEAGTDGEFELRFGIDELIAYGIRNIAEIGIGFNVERENYTNYLQTGPLYINTSVSDDYDCSLDSFERSMRKGVTPSVMDLSVLYSSGEDAADNAFIKVDNLYFTERSGEYFLLAEVVNKTGGYLNVSIDNIFINGLKAYEGSWYTCGVCAGKRNVFSISLNEVLCAEYMEFLGIDSYDSITLSVTVRGDNLYEKLSSDPVSIQLTQKPSVSWSDVPGEVLYSGSNVTIKALGMLEDPSKFYDSVHVLLLAKNSNSFNVRISDSGETYVNGAEIGLIWSYSDVGPGEWALIDIELYEGDLEDSGIGFSAIREVRIGLDIENDDYDTLDETEIVYKAFK